MYNHNEQKQSKERRNIEYKKKIYTLALLSSLYHSIYSEWISLFSSVYVCTYLHSFWSLARSFVRLFVRSLTHSLARAPCIHAMCCMVSRCWSNVRICMIWHCLHVYVVRTRTFFKLFSFCCRRRRRSRWYFILFFSFILNWGFLSFRLFLPNVLNIAHTYIHTIYTFTQNST